MSQVSQIISERGFVPSQLIQNEVSWFYNNLGIDDVYFIKESPETVANHIMALFGAKIHAFTTNEDGVHIDLKRETDEGAMYIHTSAAGVSEVEGPLHEQR